MCPDPVIVDSEVYGFWAGLILDIECAGDGESVDNCIYKAISNVSTCTHSNDVGLICRGTICIVPIVFIFCKIQNNWQPCSVH